MTHELETYGLVLLFALVAIEGCGVPLPGETALITAAVLAAGGHFDIVAVIAVAACGAISGDNSGYWIARLGGRPLLQRLPVVRDVVPPLLPRAERFFARHGAKAVFVARFFVGFRVTAAWLAGISRMRWPRFFVFNALGGISWATLIGVLAYELGRVVVTTVSRDGLYALIGLVLIALAAFALHRSRRRRRLAVEHPGVEQASE